MGLFLHHTRWDVNNVCSFLLPPAAAAGARCEEEEMVTSGSSRGLFQRRFDNGHILIDRPAAYADAGDHPTLVGKWDAAAHRRVSSA